MAANHERDSKPLTTGHSLGLLYLMLGCALAAWLLFWGLTAHFIPHSNTSAEERGQFGDMFGAINALFSAFAFAALIYTVFLQRQELELQRIELKDTRQELQRSAQAQEDSVGPSNSKSRL